MKIARAGPFAARLRQADDEPRGAADDTEPVAVLILRHLADEFSAIGAQTATERRSRRAALP